MVLVSTKQLLRHPASFVHRCNTFYHEVKRVWHTILFKAVVNIFSFSNTYIKENAEQDFYLLKAYKTDAT